MIIWRYSDGHMANKAIQHPNRCICYFIQLGSAIMSGRLWCICIPYNYVLPLWVDVSGGSSSVVYETGDFH